MNKDENDRVREGAFNRDPFAESEPFGPSAEKEGAHGQSEEPEVSSGSSDRFRPFPCHVLPEPIRRFVVEGGAALACDPTYLVLPVLAALGGAIGNSRRIQLKRTWFEPAVIWTCIISPSGTLKSPAQDLAFEPIHRRQARLMKEYEAAMVQYQSRMAEYERDYSDWKRRERDSQPVKPCRPVLRRIICSDATVEALAVRQLENPHGLLLARDELAGWVRGFDAYKQGRGGDVAHWLSMHRAGTIIVDRKAGIPPVIMVPRAAVSVAGGIQPEIFREVFGKEHRENGLAARLLLADPPRRMKRWTEAEVAQETIDAYAQMLDQLASLELRRVGDAEVPVDLQLTPSAKLLWIEFYNEHGKGQAGKDGDQAAAWSKLEGYAARLALIIHLVRQVMGDPTLEYAEAVDEQSVRAAVTITRWFRDESDRIYAQFDESPEESERRNLLMWIRARGGQVTVRQLALGPRRYRQPGAAQKALDALVAAKLGTWEWLVGDSRGGRPVQVLRLNEDPPVEDGDRTTDPDSGSRDSQPSPVSPGGDGQDSGGAPESPVNRSGDTTSTCEAQSGVASPVAESTPIGMDDDAHDPVGGDDCASGLRRAAASVAPGKATATTDPERTSDCTHRNPGYTGDGDTTPDSAEPGGLSSPGASGSEEAVRAAGDRQTSFGWSGSSLSSEVHDA